MTTPFVYRQSQNFKIKFITIVHALNKYNHLFNYSTELYYDNSLKMCDQTFGHSTEHFQNSTFSQILSGNTFTEFFRLHYASFEHLSKCELPIITCKHLSNFRCTDID